MEFVIKPGTGYFFVNGNKYPKGLYSVLNNGNRIIIANQSGHTIVKGVVSEFKDEEGNGFDNIEDLSNYLDAVFKVGGGDGDGVTNVVLTQAEYNALTPDPNTTYDIIE